MRTPPVCVVDPDDDWQECAEAIARVLEPMDEQDREMVIQALNERFVLGIVEHELARIALH